MLGIFCWSGEHRKNLFHKIWNDSFGRNTYGLAHWLAYKNFQYITIGTKTHSSGSSRMVWELKTDLSNVLCHTFDLDLSVPQYTTMLPRHVCKLAVRSGSWIINAWLRHENMLKLGNQDFFVGFNSFVFFFVPSFSFSPLNFS